VVKRSQNRRNNLDAIRMLVLDIDGVLADGTIMVDA
jgi:3-deoxy-D-manno-octulosonate 8-phosphate phosphatase KdsC-like HAD superfamily phosphatase